MRYSVLAPGKRLRPVLLMACANASGGDPEKVLDAAVAVELVHCFSLIHDDLPAIDNDDLRRGMPTCHVKFGEAIAVLAGDALFALAFHFIAKADFDPSLVLHCTRLLSSASGSDGLVGGEVIDVLTEGKPFGPKEVEQIHRRKTGILIQACCEIGALLGGADKKMLGHFSGYGDRLGLAFQVADDLLNETATSEQLGKAAKSDSLRKKATYPALYGLEGARAAAKSLANEALAHIEEIDDEALNYLATYVIDRVS